MPSIEKSKLLYGANLFLRDVTIDDALFILSLRTNPKKNRYLSPTSESLEQQIAWINNYQESKDQAYFIICNQELEPIGCIRLYNPSDFNYEWGSWLMIDGLSPSNALEAVALVFSYGKSLGFKTATLEVRKDNDSVWRFHQNFLGAQRVGEDAENYLLFFSEQLIEDNLKKLSKFLIS